MYHTLSGMSILPKRSLAFWQILGLIFFSTLFVPGRGQAPGEPATGRRAYVPNELIITYEPLGATAPRGRAILQEHAQLAQAAQVALEAQRVPLASHRPVHASLVQQLVQQQTSERAWRRRLAAARGRAALAQHPTHFARSLRLSIAPSSQPLPALAAALQSQHAHFERAGFRLLEVDLNWYLRPMAPPNDALYPAQWPHALTQAERAWEQERGDPEVIIAIIDSGVEPDHPDLAHKLVHGYDFVNVDPGDYEAWELVEGEDYRLPDNEPNDQDGHGTHVAGIAAAQGFDGTGTIGVCPNCSIMPLRASAQFFEVDEETQDTVRTGLFQSADVADALRYAVEQGASVINMSFGGTQASVYRDEILFAQQAGVVLVAAAGNEDEQTPTYPAFLPEVIAVASTNEEDQKSDFSNFGSWVDVSAPGSQVLSTFPEGLSSGVVESQVQTETQEVANNLLTFSGYTPSEGILGELVFVGLARAQDLQDPGLAWEELAGNIALIERGEITFREKVDRVRSQGAIGAIIFNQEPGLFLGTLGEARPNEIPVVSISQEDGQALRQQMAGGPLNVRLRIELLSAVHAFASGTSMAAPYVAGMAGLLKSFNPSISVQEIKAQILASVEPLPGYEGLMGTGRVSLAEFLSLSPSPPPAREQAITLFPNPTQGPFRLELQDAWTGEVHIGIYDLMGKRLQQQQALKQTPTFSTNVDLGPYPPGLYVLTLRMGDQRFSRRVIKR